MNTFIYDFTKAPTTKLGFVLVLLLCMGMMTNCTKSSSSFMGSSIEENEPVTQAGTISLETSNVSDQDFRVFDATGFKGKPDMGQFGIRSMPILYTHEFWDAKPGSRWEYPSETKIAEALGSVDRSADHTIVIDYQYWPTSGDDEKVQKSTYRYSSLYYDMKKVKPNSMIGYFNTLPVKNYWTNDPSQQRLDIWHAKNDRLQKLAQKVDAFFLPGYTRNKDRVRWETNMKYLVKETRRIGDDQPIYIFLWPQYNAPDNETLDRQYIEADYWQQQLEFARQYADGVVFYAPHNTPWDASAPWWEVTKQFMAGLGQYAAEPVATVSEFKIYDGTRFRDKPDMSQFGFSPIKVIYQMMLWDNPISEIAPWELPSRELISYWSDQARKVNSELAVIDIEHWPTKGDEELISQSISNYNTVLDWFKAAQPGMQFGYYDMVPVKNYWSYPTDKRLAIWQSRNDRLKPMADKVDVLFPQLYTFDTDQDAWVSSARYYLQEAKRISGGKPVYAFLWPQYIARDNPDLHHTYVDAEFWRKQLETARHYADGVVIWFPYKTEWEEARQGPWWEVTKQYLQELGKAKSL